MTTDVEMIMTAAAVLTFNAHIGTIEIIAGTCWTAIVLYTILLKHTGGNQNTNIVNTIRCMLEYWHKTPKLS